MPRIALIALVFAAPSLAAPVPKEGKEKSLLYVTIGGKVVAMNPEGSDEERLFDDKHTGHDTRVSPDGKRVLSVKRNGRTDGFAVTVREAGGEPVELATLGWRGTATWSADGKTVCARDVDEAAKLAKPGGDDCWKTWSIDVKTGKSVPSPATPDAPADYHLWQTTSDSLFYTRMNGLLKDEKGRFFARVDLVSSPAAKFDPTVLIPADLNVRPLAPFHDGKRWLVARIDAVPKWGVYTAGEKEVAFWEEWDRGPHHYAVSPNGKRVAYSFPVGPGGSSLWTADADGKNAGAVLESDKRITHIDWR